MSSRRRCNQDLTPQSNTASSVTMEAIEADGRFSEIVGQSVRLKMVFEQIEQVSPTDSIVLIMGETGTGKELVLRPLDYVKKLVSGLLTCKLPLDVNPVAIHATVRSELAGASQRCLRFGVFLSIAGKANQPPSPPGSASFRAWECSAP